MATYLAGSNVQSDAMQTLYFMNPSYAGYTDPSNHGNMVLISPSVGVGHNNPLTNSAQQQHHQFFSFPLPPTLAQNSLIQHSAVTDTLTSSIGQQNSSSVLFPNQAANHVYNWTGEDELSFIPSTDAARVCHQSSVNSGQQSAASDISLYGLRLQSVSGLHEQQAPLLQRDVALGLNVDNTEAAAGVGHGLSLSLSPQQPSVIQVPAYHIQLAEPGMSNGAALSHVAEGSIDAGDRFPNKWTRSLSSFRASSRDRILGSSYQNTTNDAGCIKQPLLEIGASMRAGSDGLFTRSKYLKVAQLLLDELVSVGRGFKSSLTKQIKLQAWREPTSTFNGSFPREKTLSENPVKDGISSVPVIVPSIPEHINDSVLGLTQAERQELQMKKAKLMAILAEIDQRYKQYYNQMQIVVTSFESAAGIGAAKTYTALALKTISRHFRSLRDAINNQMRITTKALGEEDALPPMMNGETSRLEFFDQQLRQRRALQQIGMMQPHAWRPQRGLPERSVSILRAWLFEHFLHPYPKDADKLVLARQAGLTRSQVSNWFINARVRLWKPMVEEMYEEETKEAGMEAAGAMTDKMMPNETHNLSKNGSAIDGTRGSVSHEHEKQTKTEAKKEEGTQVKQEGTQVKQTVPDRTSEMLNGRSPSMNMASCISDGQFSHENSTRQGVKKPRHAIQESPSLASPNASINVDIKSEETPSGDMCENDNKLSEEDRLRRDDYSFSHNGVAGLGGFGSIPGMGGMSTRYSQEIPAAARYSGGSGVSLTLGLHRCDGLSLSAAAQQHHYVYAQQSDQQPGRLQEGGGGEREEGYYIHDNSAGQSNSSYETVIFPNRKRFAPTQLLQQHDFAA